MSQDTVQRQLAEIQARNQRVEQDKAWEVSLTRTGLLAVITYLCASLLLWLIAAPTPLLGALIPTMGYILSTQSLPLVKRWWLNNKNKKGDD